MKFFAEIYTSNNKEAFRPYRTYEIIHRDNGFKRYWKICREDYNEIETDRLDEMEKHINDLGCECRIVSIPDNVVFFKYVGSDNGDFKADQVYSFNANTIDWGKENPLENCVNGVKIKNWNMNNVNTMKARHVAYGEDYNIGTVYSDFKYAANLCNKIIVISYSTYFREKYKEKLAVAKRYPKAELTVQEYNSVFKAITELLDEYDYVWTKEGVNKVIDTWLKEKGELITAFREHPNYNGNFQLVFSNQFYRLDTDKNSGSKFVNWVDNEFCKSDLLVPRVIEGHTFKEWAQIRDMYNRRLPDLHPMVTGDSIQLFNVDLYKDIVMKREMTQVVLNCFKSEYTDESIKEYNRCRQILDIIYCYSSDRVDERLAGKMNTLFPEFRVREGQKTTKVFGKVMHHYGIDKIEDYTKKWADYCDGINVINITRHTIMSVHPVDYLTMSFGNSWASCHTIDKENKRCKPDNYQGMYSSGTISYMLDNSSFVLYTVDRNYNGNTFYEKDKINRCMFHVMNERILQGRCYPQKEDGNEGLYTQFRTLVQKVMSEIWDISNTWTIKRGSGMREVISTYGTHYPDYDHFDNCNMSVYKYTDIEHEYGVMKVGHNPICVECGEEHETQDNINCCGNTRWICPECGAVVERDDDYIEIEGERYHEDCAFYCEYHQCYEPMRERYDYVENYGDICDYAYECTDSFARCENCGDVYYIDDVYDTVNGFVCHDCLEDYVYIDRINSYIPEADATYCEYCNNNFITENADVNENGHIVCPECGSVIGEEVVA